MGRIKKYDRDDVLNIAMKLFWLHGYDAVSTHMLVENMGINRKSVYAEFGNKQKLYYAALERYLQTEIPLRFPELKAENAGLQAVFETLSRFAQAAGKKGTERGCMLCNAASETAYQNITVQGFVDEYFNYIRSTFQTVLQASVRSHELSDDFDINAWSSSLATTLIGMFVMIRSRTNANAINAAANLAIAQLEKLKQDNPPNSPQTTC